MSTELIDVKSEIESPENELTELKDVSSFSLPPRYSVNIFDPIIQSSVMAICEATIKAGLCPKWASNNANKLMIAVIYGHEIGLSVMQSIVGVCVINGVPSLWGDVFLGFCLAQPTRDYIEEWVEGETFYCRSKRLDRRKEVVASFSLSQAKKAGLFDKTGPWSQYPMRMMQMRPRGWSLRDNWADKLRGIQIYEEAVDMGKGSISIEETPIHMLEENKNRLKFLIENSTFGNDRVQKLLSWAQCNSIDEIGDHKTLIAINKIEKEFPDAKEQYIKHAISKIEFSKC